SRPNPQPLAVLTNPAYLAQVLQLGFGIPAVLAPGLVSNLKPVHREEFANYGENTAYDVYAGGTVNLSDKFLVTGGRRNTSGARGRRPDVISTSAPATPLGQPRFNVVDSEVVDSYEAGAKGKLMGGRLYLSGSVFRYDYDNFATSFRQGAQVVTLNAGKAKAYG